MALKYILVILLLACCACATRASGRYSCDLQESELIFDLDKQILEFVLVKGRFAKIKVKFERRGNYIHLLNIVEEGGSHDSYIDIATVYEVISESEDLLELRGSEGVLSARKQS